MGADWENGSSAFPPGPPPDGDDWPVIEQPEPLAPVALVGSSREKCVRVKKDGVRCLAWPIQGGTVCIKHGGARKATKEAGERRVMEGKVEKALDRKVASVERAVGSLKATGRLDDPYQALLDVAGRTIVYMEKVGELVEGLENIRYRGMVTEQLRAEAALYGQLLKDSTSVLATISRLNLDERMVRIRESQARMVQGAVEKGLRAAGVHGDALRRAREETAKHLRLIA